MTEPNTADLVTKAEFDLAMARIDGRFELLQAQLNARFAQVETAIERANIASIRWSVGVGFGLYALIFGLILFVVSRELPHV